MDKKAKVAISALILFSILFVVGFGAPIIAHYVMSFFRPEPIDLTLDIPEMPTYDSIPNFTVSEYPTFEEFNRTKTYEEIK